MTQSLAQLRAKDALEKIGNIGNDYGKYVSYVKALPATIIMSGLGQALAMEKAGKKKGHDIVYNHMNAWLCRRWQGENTPHDILTAIVNEDEAHYFAAQAEAMEYLEWLKKFAVANLNEETGESGGE